MKPEILTRTPVTKDERPHLVFIHGAFHGAWCWAEHFLPFFAEQGWHSHAISLRGHESHAPRTGMANWSLEDYETDVRRFLTDLGRPVVLIGHSMGGVVAQMCFSHEPSVVGLVPFASSPLRPSPGVVRRMLWQHPIALLWGQLRGNPDIMGRAMRSFFFSEDLDEASLSRYREQLTSESQLALREVFSRDAPEVAADERRPVLVVAGRDDWSIPMADHEWLADLYHGDLKVCSGAHDIMLDPGWQDSADTIRVWLEEKFGR